MDREPIDALVWRTGALGDFVLTLPVLSALRERCQKLTVIAPPAYEVLFPDADRWLDSDGTEAMQLYAGRTELEADVGVVWTQAGARALRSCGLGNVLLGIALPSGGVHQVDALWNPLQEWVGPRDRDPAVPAYDAPHLEEHRGAVVIAPGSGGTRKRWDLSRWQAVADAVEGPVVWVGGPLERTETGWGSPRLNRLDLTELVGLARICRCWVGPDAGPQHLAAAAGASVGAVFVGASDPRSWAPVGSRVFGPELTESDVVDWIATHPT